jgi:hypothetical protein
MPVLKQGSSGPDVTTLQTRLKQLGFDPKGVDGVFGSRTKAALIAFQKSKGLTADGMGGPATMAALQQGESAAAIDDPQSSAIASTESNSEARDGGEPLGSSEEPKVVESLWTAQLDRIVERLVDGNEEDRARILRQIQTSKQINKQALAGPSKSRDRGQIQP